MKSVLFLCTGNYYRSRYAEELFNHLAAAHGLNWSAASRALAIERGKDNVGPVSAHAVNALKEQGINGRGLHRLPLQCVVGDLEAADLVIALQETEHRSLLQTRFASWEDRVTYWHVQDIEFCAVQEAIATIDRHVAELIRQLGQRV